MVSAVEALKEGAPQLHPEAPGNLIFDWDIGEEKATNDAFAKAAHVTKMDIVNNRLVPNAMEPRATLGVYDAGGGPLHVLDDVTKSACRAPGDERIL